MTTRGKPAEALTVSGIISDRRRRPPSGAGSVRACGGRRCSGRWPFSAPRAKSRERGPHPVEDVVFRTLDVDLDEVQPLQARRQDPAVERHDLRREERDTVGTTTPTYRYERDVEQFFRHSPAVVRENEA